MMTEADKTAVIDVGSNSGRLVVYYGAKRAPLQFFNEKVVCGLGRGLADSGVLDPEGRKRALNAIRRFVGIAQRMGVGEIHTVATAAVRNAQDGADFCAEVLAGSNLKLRIVTGAREATLSAQGVLFCRPQACGLVCDMGGSSMELAEVSDGEVLGSSTSNLGPLQLQKFEGDAAAFQHEIETQLVDLTQNVTPLDTIYMIGGTIRAIAGLDMAQKQYPLNVLNEYMLSRSEFEKVLNGILVTNADEIYATGAVSSDRLAYMPIVACVLLELLGKLKPEWVVFSSFGIREGVLYENMTSDIQRHDPLIEACQFAEKADARFMGFGAMLYNWVMPLFLPTDDARRRLIRAACLLHDVTWKAHPSYRVEASFDYATRSILVGLDHQERFFLAVALMYR